METRPGTARDERSGCGTSEQGTQSQKDRVPVISSRYTSSACVEGGHDLAVLVVRGSVNSRLHVLQTSLQFTRFLRDRGSPDDRFIIVRGSLLYRNAS